MNHRTINEYARYKISYTSLHPNRRI